MSWKRFARKRDNDKPFERDSRDGRQQASELIGLLLLFGQSGSVQLDKAVIDWCYGKRLQMPRHHAQFISGLNGCRLPLPPEKRARLHDVVRDLGKGLVL
jgi:hypothetical protein